ncbi:zinc-dependent alcohol dehydrogenase family protein [Arthrobacter bambusae]|nr:zinc-binding dehydrogenase [Arthrobacter bambusae]
MKAAVFLGNRTLELRDFPDPRPGFGEVLVAVRASGLCGSDLHIYRDAPGKPATSGSCIMGHEPAGVIHAVGAGVSPDLAAVGQRVIVHHYAGCTYCDACRSGWPQMCTTAPARVFGIDDHGAHAPFMRVPIASLVPLDDRLTFEAGAAIGCGTGTAWGALDRLGDVGGATIAVFGQGPVGLSATLLATARGARVVAIDPEPARRLQAERFGAIATIDPMSVSAAAAVRELTDGPGVSLALETSGSTAATADAIAALAPWGKLCLVGLGGEVQFKVFDYLRSQMTLLTSWTMSVVQLRRCAEFIARNNLPIGDLYSHRWRLDQIVDAYEEFDKQRAGKGVITFDGPST